MEVILTMSYKEGDRQKIIAKIESRSKTIEDSSGLLKINQRQTFSQQNHNVQRNNFRTL